VAKGIGRERRGNSCSFAKAILTSVRRIAKQIETAKRWSFENGSGEIGIIAPVTEPFCGHCNRIRLTCERKNPHLPVQRGRARLETVARGGANDEGIADWLQGSRCKKRSVITIGEPEFVQPERSMSCIGG